MLQGLREQAQHAVAFQMPEAVVDLLEPIHVANHRHQAGGLRACSAPTRGRVAGTASGHSAARSDNPWWRSFPPARYFRAFSMASAIFELMASRMRRVVRGERIVLQLVQREHRHYSRKSFQGYGQRRAQGAELCGIVEISRLDRGIAVDDRLLVLGYPSGESLPHAEFASDENRRKLSPLTYSGDKFVAVTLHKSRWRRRGPAGCIFMENTESVSSRLSEAPRSWLNSKSVCASWRAAAMEDRKLASWPSLAVFARTRHPGHCPLSTFTSVESLESFRVLPNCALTHRSSSR